jgi:hypothetical protein
MATAETDAHAGPFRRQVAAVLGLMRANSALLRDNAGAWDDWHDRAAKLPEEARWPWRAAGEIVRRIEEGAARIGAERDKLPGLRDAAMVAKIASLAAEWDGSGDAAERAEADFAEFRAWRVAALDGVDCDMFDLVPQRAAEKWARSRRLEAAPLFERLFVTWARTAGVDVAELRAAAMLRRAAAEGGGPGMRP